MLDTGAIIQAMNKLETLILKVCIIVAMQCLALFETLPVMKMGGWELLRVWVIIFHKGSLNCREFYEFSILF